MRKILSNRAQVSLELALLLAVVVVVASAVGFYYLKSVVNGSNTAEITSKNATITAKNKALDNIYKAKRALNG
ncbi:MAG: class III signal peptide domain-containing protein, archaeosortase D/PIP-CTERM system-associated [Methanococci archaeon]|uniref:Class III signal peptide-containing protein n=1 Tax=Methanocaldococcus vulcanius (strain ATCC 700851 / DSM 12094 / M7) TaxID=579137 RepID=C9RIG0_METVM|nr:class III signal peptide domain-containing protein, archaeosortase D/PIP-CTERM system-associated [Methanocaldococcus vulcanius]ACX73362.1 Protein of unknown function DUF361 [Methanocaldococcus vulcanius M7]NPA63215.1 class III signal peptide domain-containing protein, archaeosortase D/PIP-CTERM system-associated [Methanococci archaeon]